MDLQVSEIKGGAAEDFCNIKFSATGNLEFYWICWRTVFSAFIFIFVWSFILLIIDGTVYFSAFELGDRACTEIQQEGRACNQNVTAKF